MESNLLDIKVKRIFKLADNHPLKAFVDITLNDVFLLRSIKVIEGKNGLFVSMPQEQAKDKKWYPYFRAINEQTREQLSNEVLAAYSAQSN